MTCSPFDLRDYYLKELTDPQQRQVEAHVKDCPACREELDRLRLTQAALYSLRDEEIPQRIAFVSDPIFEPSPARRWLAAFWGSGARLGFAGAALLSGVLLFSALRAPSSGVASADVDRRIERAVSASEARQTQTTTQLVKGLVDRVDSEHNLRIAAEQDARLAKEQYLALEKTSGAYINITPASN